jgi:uncharacterized protein (DUF302 family)
MSQPPKLRSGVRTTVMSSDAKEPTGSQPAHQVQPPRPAESSAVESPATKAPSAPLPGTLPVSGKQPPAIDPPVKPPPPAPADVSPTAAKPPLPQPTTASAPVVKPAAPPPAATPSVGGKPVPPQASATGAGGAKPPATPARPDPPPAPRPSVQPVAQQKPSGPPSAAASTGKTAASSTASPPPTETAVRASNPAMPLRPTVTAIYGLVRQRSQYSVAETTRRLTALVQARGQQVFGDIDFAGDAGRAGMSMRPMRQLVFGHPRSGTPLILAAPTVALDLPLRVLIFEDANGAVWIAYNDAEYLRERHQLPDGLLANISVLPDLVARAVGTERLDSGG